MSDTTCHMSISLDGFVAGVESLGFEPVEVLHSPRTSATGGRGEECRFRVAAHTFHVSM
ncbi:MAG: hypothetical protein JJE13_13035 [Thermoleophilia bacterium]|nr:hypothetical protein [Thermoleophilia bacterium]